MKFQAKTAPPAGKADKADEVKSLLFRAVALYVENDEAAREELLGLLSDGQPDAKAS